MKALHFAAACVLTICMSGTVAAPAPVAVEVLQAPFSLLTRNRLDENQLRQIGCTYQTDDREVAAEVAVWLDALPAASHEGALSIDPRLLVRVRGDGESVVAAGSPRQSAGHLALRGTGTKTVAVTVSGAALAQLAELLKRMSLVSAGAHCLPVR